MKRLGLLFALLWLAGLPALANPALDLSVFRNLAIQQGGRLKPVDTFAREAVRLITGKAQWEDQDPVATALTWWAQGDKTSQAQVIELRNLELKQKLGLSAEQRWFSYKELVANEKLRAMADQIRQADKDEQLSQELQNARDVLVKARYLEMVADGSAWTIIPNPGGQEAEWGSFMDLFDPNKMGGTTSAQPLRDHVDAIRKAVLAGNGVDFSQEVAEFSPVLSQLGPYPDPQILARETHYNAFHPFRWAYVVYISALACLFFAANSQSMLYWLGLSLAWSGFSLHIYGFYLRCSIAGRPPVTNMYESIVWVAFGAVLFSLIFETVYRARVYLLASMAGAAVCLILADNLPAVLDPSIRPLTPVLRSNFWLTIHVLTITLGYAAFLLALGLGHMILWKYITGPDKREQMQGLNKALYKAIQVGVLLLASGTILGGVWASYSWGRFWGWDPKEVWALIALLGYLSILHGRYAGWLGNFGTAAASVLAFQGVLFAWYGVNFVLGAGLHSYGFGTGGVQYVACYVAAELLFVGYALSRHRKLRAASRRD